MKYGLTLCIALGIGLFVSHALLAQTKAGDKSKDDEITLERLYPEDGLFGPRARSAAFSADGRYAAYLYRPYNERRHGSDLWLYDFQTDKPTRVTDVAVMSQFQRSARQVADDRLAKHKKAEKEQADKEKGDKDQDEDNDKDEDKGEGSGESQEKTKEELEIEEAKDKQVDKIKEEVGHYYGEYDVEGFLLLMQERGLLPELVLPSEGK